jgi:hypothetical protein
MVFSVPYIRLIGHIDTVLPFGEAIYAKSNTAEREV